AGVKGVEACGHDADQGSLSATHDKTLAEDLWIAAEFALPSAVIQDKHERRIGATIFFRDRAAKQRRQAQIIGRFRLFSGRRSQIETPAVEVNRVNEILFVPESPSCVFDPLDLRVERFARSIGDAMP